MANIKGNTIKLEATKLRGCTYVVRPHGQLGTCGWYPVAWTAQIIKAHSEESAIALATPVYKG